MSKILLRRPRPAISSAVHPATPMTVIHSRFLYRNRFRAETFMEKLIRFHTGVTRSSRIRFPARGALGRISAAGLSRAVDSMAQRVAPTVQATPAAPAIRIRPQ